MPCFNFKCRRMDKGILLCTYLKACYRKHKSTKNCTAEKTFICADQDYLMQEFIECCTLFNAYNSDLSLLK